MQPRTTALAVGLALLASGDALAQSTERTAGESIALSAGTNYGDARSKANDWMIMPGGTTTLGGSIQFLTAHAGLGDEPLRFTDVVLMSLQLRRAFEDRFEVFAAASFLPKQPSFTDELAWQSATAGGRIGFVKRYAAQAAASGGPLLGDRGTWAAGAANLQARKSLHETLVVEGSLGSVYTALFEKDRAQTSWVTELSASAELVFREPHGMTAGWIGTEFRFPLAHVSGRSEVGAMPYDPQTRVNVHLGVVLSYIENWDIFARFVVVDRGDQVAPATTLPILEGGFDQRHLLIGLTRRFRPEKKRHRSQYLAE